MKMKNPSVGAIVRSVQSDGCAEEAAEAQGVSVSPDAIFEGAFSHHHKHIIISSGSKRQEMQLPGPEQKEVVADHDPWIILHLITASSTLEHWGGTIFPLPNCGPTPPPSLMISTEGLHVRYNNNSGFEERTNKQAIRDATCVTSFCALMVMAKTKMMISN